MKEVQAKEEPPFESWSKLIEKTMSVYPVTQAFSSAARDGKEDPWFALIDRLWDAVQERDRFPDQRSKAEVEAEIEAARKVYRKMVDRDEGR